MTLLPTFKTLYLFLLWLGRGEFATLIFTPAIFFLTVPPQNLSSLETLFLMGFRSLSHHLIYCRDHFLLFVSFLTYTFCVSLKRFSNSCSFHPSTFWSFLCISGQALVTKLTFKSPLTTGIIRIHLWIPLLPVSKSLQKFTRGFMVTLLNVKSFSKVLSLEYCFLNSHYYYISHVPHIYPMPFLPLLYGSLPNHSLFFSTEEHA